MEVQEEHVKNFQKLNVIYFYQKRSGLKNIEFIDDIGVDPRSSGGHLRIRLTDF